MTRTTRFHVDELPNGALAPKHLTKQQFGRRLYQMMLARGWNQSELARQAGLPRDSISTYVRGVALPTPKSLQALATALGVPAAEVLPNAIEMAVDEDHPSFEIKVSPSAPSTAWLRVNRLVSLSTATRVAELIEADQVGAQRASTDGA
jgi:transcriptional regulator with XRE-family HTH domain